MMRLASFSRYRFDVFPRGGGGACLLEGERDVRLDKEMVLQAPIDGGFLTVIYPRFRNARARVLVALFYFAFVLYGI